MKKINKLLCYTLVLLASIAFLTNKAYASNSIPNMTPVHSYTFDSDTGTTVIDSGSGKAVNGINNGTSLVTGYDNSGFARHFTGSSYITLSSSVIPLGEKTISFKIRKASVTGKVEYFFGNEYNGNINYGMCGYVYTNGSLGFELNKANSIGAIFSIGSKKNICDNKWHDVLLTWDGSTNSNAVKLYVDDMSTPNNTTTAKAIENHASSYNLYIGSLALGKAVNFVGDIDNFAVYDKTYVNAPLNLAAISNNDNIDLSWNAVEGATSYNIKRSITTGGPYDTVATGSAIIFTDTDVDPGVTYYYIVSAVVSGTESANSNEASAIIEVTPITNILKVVLEVDEELQLSVDDDLDVNTEMNWTSSDNTVAKVDTNGVVTALSPGNTVITATSEDGTYTDYINVLVVDNAHDYRLAVDLKVGKSCRLTVDDLTDTVPVIWDSMDPMVATVASNGKVKALSKGLTLITATDEEGNIIGQIYVRVRV